MVYLLLAVAAAGLIRFSLVWNFVTDDAFISFVYARNLVEHGQLVFNLGERVEGYTNFLWTLLLAAGLAVGIPAEWSARVLGTGAAVGTLIVAAFVLRRVRGGDRLIAWDAVPSLLLAAIPGFACWASGGLETALFTLLVVAAVGVYLKEQLSDDGPRVSAVLFGLSALTRPEGVLVFGVTGIHFVAATLLQRKKITRDLVVRVLLWGLIFAAFVVPHFVWRKSYYGWWLPNTFYIKSVGGAGTWQQGGYYLWSATKQFHLWAPAVLGVAGLLVRRPRAAVRFASHALLLVAAYLVYVAKVGGDFMGLFRFIMPPIVLLYLFGAVGLWLLFGERPRLALPVVALLLAGHVAHAVPVTKQSLTIGADRGIDTPGFLRWYTADRAVIGKWFGQYAQPDDLMAVGGAGAQVYYARMAALDCYGLSDAYIAHELKAISNRPGHQKYATLEYQLKRKPTIITSNYYKFEPRPFVPSRHEAEEWRRRGFHFVSVEMPELKAGRYYVFLKRLDRAIGPLPVAPDEPEHP